eukprot:4674894-Amphidinium_carterae.1
MQALQRITALLVERMPQYQQVFDEVESVAMEELFQGSGERPQSQSDRRRILQPKRGRHSGAGVYPTPPPTQDDMVDEHAPLETPKT